MKNEYFNKGDKTNVVPFSPVSYKRSTMPFLNYNAIFLIGTMPFFNSTAMTADI